MGGRSGERSARRRSDAEKTKEKRKGRDLFEDDEASPQRNQGDMKLIPFKMIDNLLLYSHH
jgi:hypothetical protein